MGLVKTARVVDLLGVGIHLIIISQHKAVEVIKL